MLGWMVAKRPIEQRLLPPQVPWGCGHVGAGQAVPVGPEPAGDTSAGARGGFGHRLCAPRHVVRLLHGEEHHGIWLGAGWSLLNPLGAVGGKPWLSPVSPDGGRVGDGCPQTHA